VRAARNHEVPPFLPTARDLERVFHAAPLRLGRQIARGHGVSLLEFEAGSSNAIELRGQVMDREQHRFQVGVRLLRRNAGSQVEIDSHCSCPLGQACEHAAALLVHWQPRLAGDATSEALSSFARPWNARAPTAEDTAAEEDALAKPHDSGNRLVHGLGTACVRLAAAGFDAPDGGAAPSALFASLRIDGIHVPLQRAAGRIVVDGEVIDVEPDAQQAERVLHELFEAGASPWPASIARPSRSTKGAAGDLGGESAFEIPDERAAGLLLVQVPAWRELGWEVTIDETFPWQELDASGFEARLLPEAGRTDWFDLELGLRLGDTVVPLLPLLDAALGLEGEGARGGAEGDPLPARITLRVDETHVVRLDRERLAPLLGTLLELGDPRRRAAREAGVGDARGLRLSRLDLARLAALEEQRVVRWVGPVEARDFARRLASFTHLKSANVPAGLRAELRPYQKTGLDWLQFLREYGLGGLLADDMGLGKTLQTLAHLLLEKEEGRLTLPALVIAPTSLVHNWVAEAARFAPGLRTLQLHGAERKREFERIPGSDLVVTSTALLARDIEDLARHEYHALVVDEAHHVKNPRTQAAGALRLLRAGHRIALTGTPLENHLGELWAQFDWLTPGLLGDAANFTRMYRNPIEKRGDEARRAHLTTRIRPFLLRRSKDEVAPELPARTEIERLVELEGGQREIYDLVRASVHERVRRALAEQGLEGSQIIVLDALLKLRQVCCDPRLVALERARKVQESAKLDLLMELLESMLPEGRRVLLFSQFTSMLRLIEEELHKRGIEYALLTGDTRDRARQVERFQGGEVPLFLLSLRAGGTGLNLTAADTVIHYDPWWNPAVEAQATDRAHRIGQDKPVFVYRLLCAGTIEERMRSLQARKARLAQTLLGDEAGLARALSSEDIEALLAPDSVEEDDMAITLSPGPSPARSAGEGS
jgi:superfamily II DNA or RNA helicase